MFHFDKLKNKTKQKHYYSETYETELRENASFAIF